MNRVAIYIDGFNVYNRVASFCTHLKWLDYFKLFKSLLKKEDTITKIAYFTAIRSWEKNTAARHKTYIRALYDSIKLNDPTNSSLEFTVYKGHFSKIEKQEKETDVNIAIQMISDAFLDVYDTAILCSSDTDFVPIFKQIKELSKENMIPEKKIGILLPLNRAKTGAFNNIADLKFQMMDYHIISNQFPDIFPDNDTIRKPTDWKCENYSEYEANGIACCYCDIKNNQNEQCVKYKSK